MKAWLKGGLIGGIIGIVISSIMGAIGFFFLYRIDECYACILFFLPAYFTPLRSINLFSILTQKVLIPELLLNILIFFVVFFIIGSTISWIVGKIKGKKTNPPLAVQQEG